MVVLVELDVLDLRGEVIEVFENIEVLTKP